MVRTILAAFPAPFMAASTAAAELRIVDGDTIRLGRERIRIVGYDKSRAAGAVSGRTVGREGGDVARAIIVAGHGRPYHGGRRQGWC